MTTNEFLEKNQNPWEEVADMYKPDKADCLFGNSNRYFCKDDEKMINEYNQKLEESLAGKDEKTQKEILKDKIVTNIPAEPWWGNPLTARLIILSLNPGYVPEVNEKLAKLLQSNDAVRKQLIEYKARTLRFEVDSFLPMRDEYSNPISCKDAVNMLGDWYWYKKLRYLKEDVYQKNRNIGEDEFFKRIALIEFHAYSSETSNRTFPLHKKYLKSQEFIRDLIYYIAQKEDVHFLIMRGKEKWQNLLNTAEYNFFESEKAKILCKANKGMSQAITRNNLDGDYDKIVELLLK